MIGCIFLYCIWRLEFLLWWFLFIVYYCFSCEAGRNLGLMHVPYLDCIPIKLVYRYILYIQDKHPFSNTCATNTMSFTVTYFFFFFYILTAYYVAQIGLKIKCSFQVIGNTDTHYHAQLIVNVLIFLMLCFVCFMNKDILGCNQFYIFLLWRVISCYLLSSSGFIVLPFPMGLWARIVWRSPVHAVCRPFFSLNLWGNQLTVPHPYFLFH